MVALMAMVETEVEAAATTGNGEEVHDNPLAGAGAGKTEPDAEELALAAAFAEAEAKAAEVDQRESSIAIEQRLSDEKNVSAELLQLQTQLHAAGDSKVVATAEDVDGSDTDIEEDDDQAKEAAPDVVTYMRQREAELQDRLAQLNQEVKVLKEHPDSLEAATLMHANDPVAGGAGGADAGLGVPQREASRDERARQLRAEAVKQALEVRAQMSRSRLEEANIAPDPIDEERRRLHLMRAQELDRKANELFEREERLRWQEDAWAAGVYTTPAPPVWNGALSYGALPAQASVHPHLQPSAHLLPAGYVPQPNMHLPQQPSMHDLAFAPQGVAQWTPPAPAPLRGILMKRSLSAFASYQERAVVVKDGLLAYVSGRGEIRSMGLGEIVYLGRSNSRRHSYREFCLKLANGRKYDFRTSGPDDLEFWLHGLQQHIEYERRQGRFPTRPGAGQLRDEPQVMARSGRGPRQPTRTS